MKSKQGLSKTFVCTKDGNLTMLMCDDGSSSGPDDFQEKCDADGDGSITPGLMMYVSDGSEEYSANFQSKHNVPAESEMLTAFKPSTPTTETKECVVSRKRKSSRPLKEPTFDYEPRESPQLAWSEQDHINFEKFNDTSWKFSNNLLPQMYEKSSGLECFNAFNASDQDASYHTDANGMTVLKCSECPKTFRTLQQLRQHMLVHSNIRKHSCRFCDKTFKQQCHLQQHERLHTGELPYKCHIGTCNKAFRQSSNLKLHVKMHISYLNKEFHPSVSHVTMSTSSPDLAYEDKEHSDSTDMPDLLSSCLLKQSSVYSTICNLQNPQNFRTTVSPMNVSSAVTSSLSTNHSFVTSNKPSSSNIAHKSTHLLSSKTTESINVASLSRINSEHTIPSNLFLPTSESYQTLEFSSTDEVVCTPVHQQSLMLLSRKLYEISQRKELQLLNADRQLHSPFKQL